MSAWASAPNVVGHGFVATSDSICVDVDNRPGGVSGLAVPIVGFVCELFVVSCGVRSSCRANNASWFSRLSLSLSLLGITFLLCFYCLRRSIFF